MSIRTTLADALHQAGDVEQAGAAFREAEAMQAERQPEFPLLYSLQGYRYCDLLLGGGQYAEVQRRASQTLEWARQCQGLTSRHRPGSPLPGAGVPRPGGHGLRWLR